MRPARLAHAFLLLAVLFAWFWLATLTAQDGGERATQRVLSSIGRNVPDVVGTSEACPTGHILASGVIEPESADPNFHTVGGLTFAVHPDGIPAQILTQYHGKKVEIVIREIK